MRCYMEKNTDINIGHTVPTNDLSADSSCE